MNVLEQAMSADGDSASPAVPDLIGNDRQERNRQRRAWRNSPANPRNRSRGGTRVAGYDRGR